MGAIIASNISHLSVVTFAGIAISLVFEPIHHLEPAMSPVFLQRMHWFLMCFCATAAQAQSTSDIEQKQLVTLHSNISLALSMDPRGQLSDASGGEAFALPGQGTPYADLPAPVRKDLVRGLALQIQSGIDVNFGPRQWDALLAKCLETSSDCEEERHLQSYFKKHNAFIRQSFGRWFYSPEVFDEIDHGLQKSIDRCYSAQEAGLAAAFFASDTYAELMQAQTDKILREIETGSKTNTYLMRPSRARDLDHFFKSNPGAGMKILFCHMNESRTKPVVTRVLSLVQVWMGTMREKIANNSKNE